MFDMRSQVSRNKVFVGLSGGVDSAVSAALLKKAGYDVHGVFIRVWQPDWITCNWKEDRIEAMRVAAHLDIPFTTLDLEKEYKKEVIDYMIAEYKAGRTPNPDVMCNRYVKFGAFWNWAKENGADFIATGHYSRIGERRTENGASAVFSLLAGKDKNKDQSYFLWTLNQNDLRHILFPVGHLQKDTVRKLAKKFKLPNADRKDSQGLCFIGKVDVKDFLKHYIDSNPGDVLNENGTVIGNHPGSELFTIGERHGFAITEKTPNDSPYYVTKKDVAQNTITVSNKDSSEQTHSRKIVQLKKVNWVSDSAPLIKGPARFPLQARGRYRQVLVKCRIIEATNSTATIEFEKPQDTLTPGQSLVIYKGEECLGGGIIE